MLHARVKMAIIDKLAHSLGSRSELPNQALAATLAAQNDKAGVREVVTLLHHPTKDIQHDSIKVLYEIGRLKPAMISTHLPEFLHLLSSKNNRMQWGAMAAIDSITENLPEKIYESLPLIINAADIGSVITRDHAVFILVKLCGFKKYAADAFELLLSQIRNCPANQLPMYAEKSLPLINGANKASFVSCLRSRLHEMPTAAKQARVEKVIRQSDKVMA